MSKKAGVAEFVLPTHKPHMLVTSNESSVFISLKGDGKCDVYELSGAFIGTITEEELNKVPDPGRKDMAVKSDPEMIRARLKKPSKGSNEEPEEPKQVPAKPRTVGAKIKGRAQSSSIFDE